MCNKHQKSVNFLSDISDYTTDVTDFVRKKVEFFRHFFAEKVAYSGNWL